MKKRYLVLRAGVWIICVYLVLLGLILNGPVKGITYAATNFLGASKMPDASALFLARMLGAYLVVFGIGMGIAAWNPIKNRALLTLGAILLVLRSIQRLVCLTDLQNTLGISTGHNWMTVVLVLLFAIFLMYFRFRLYHDMGKENS
ncbi:hypothetical protein ACFL1F_00835 [Chlamydiota bacterium]